MTQRPERFNLIFRDTNSIFHFDKLVNSSQLDIFYLIILFYCIIQSF